MKPTPARQARELAYRAYFTLASLRPIGAIDLAWRRMLGRWFNGACPPRDVQMIRTLARRRKNGCASLFRRQPVADGDLPALTAVVTISDDSPCIVDWLESIRTLDYPPNRLSFIVFSECPAQAKGVKEWLTTVCDERFSVICGDSFQTNEDALNSITSPFVLLASEMRYLQKHALRGAVAFAISQPDDVVAWQLSPTLTEQAGYCDPVTLEITDLAPGLSLVRTKAFRGAGLPSGVFPHNHGQSGLWQGLRDSGGRVQSIGRSIDFEIRDPANKTTPGDATAAPEYQRVSIIIRSYAGREAWLRQSLCSVLNQTYPALEVIVAEDGGSALRSLVEDLGAHLEPGRTVRHLALPKVGKSIAGNAGLEASSGDLIGFLDDDDLLLPVHVELLYNAVRAEKDAVAAYALAWEAQTPTAQFEPEEGVHFEVPAYTRRPFDRERLREINFLPIQAVLFRRSCYEVAGGFDPGRKYLEDWALWDKFAGFGRFVYLPRITSIFRTPADPYERIARVRKRERRSLVDSPRD